MRAKTVTVEIKIDRWCLQSVSRHSIQTCSSMSTALSPRDPNKRPTNLAPIVKQKRRPSAAAAADAAGSRSSDGAAKRHSLPARSAMKKELRVEVKKLAETLGSKTTEWKDRVSGLKRIASMASGEYDAAAPTAPEYLSAFVALCAPLMVQLSELRSAIISEVVATIAVLAESLGGSFDELGMKLMPSLLELSGRGKKVMSDYGSTAITAIATHCHGQHTLGAVLKILPKKPSPPVTLQCAKFVRVAVEQWPVRRSHTHWRSTSPHCEHFPPAPCSPCAGVLKCGSLCQESMLEPFQPQIGASIVVSLNAKSAEARADGRKAFLAYCNAWPADGDALLSSLEGSVQRALRKEFPELEVIARYRQLPPCAARTQSPSSSVCQKKSRLFVLLLHRPESTASTSAAPGTLRRRPPTRPQLSHSLAHSRSRQARRLCRSRRWFRCRPWTNIWTTTKTACRRSPPARRCRWWVIPTPACFSSNAC